MGPTPVGGDQEAGGAPFSQTEVENKVNIRYPKYIRFTILVLRILKGLIHLNTVGDFGVKRCVVISPDARVSENSVSIHRKSLRKTLLSETRGRFRFFVNFI